MQRLINSFMTRFPTPTITEREEYWVECVATELDRIFQHSPNQRLSSAAGDIRKVFYYMMFSPTEAPAI